MKRAKSYHRRTPAWCWVVLLTAAALLPGRLWMGSSEAAAPPQAPETPAGKPAAAGKKVTEGIKTLTWTETETIVPPKKPRPRREGEGRDVEPETTEKRCAYKAPGLEREEVRIKYRRMTQDGRMRSSHVSIWDFAKGKGLSFGDAEEKVARVTYFKLEPEKRFLLKHPWLLKDVKRVLTSPAVKSLGKKTVDGKEAAGYRIEERRGWGSKFNEEAGEWDEVKATSTWEIWLAAKTHHVISAKLTVVPDPDDWETYIVTYKGFVHNTPLEQSLFDMEPEGYTLVPGRGFMSWGGERKTPDPPPWPPARWKEEYGDRLEVFIEPKEKPKP